MSTEKKRKLTASEKDESQTKSAKKAKTEGKSGSEKITKKPEPVEKKTKPKQKKKYGLTLLFLSGDDDFGAVQLQQNYTSDTLINECIRNGGSASFAADDDGTDPDNTDSDRTLSLHASVERFEFSTKKDCETAERALRAVLSSDVIDYEHSKNTCVEVHGV